MFNHFLNKPLRIHATAVWFLFSVLFLSTTAALAQPLRIFWAQTGGGRYDDWAHIALDSAGNVVVTGAISDPGQFADHSFGLTASNFQEILLAKLAPDGSLLWANASGGGLMDAASDVAVNAGGQILIGGFFREPFNFFGGPRLESTGDRDAFSALFATDGSLRWIKRGGGTLRDFTHAVDFDASGNAMAAGQLRRGGDFDGTPASAQVNGSVFVTRQRASSGAVEQLTVFGHAGAWDIAALNDGGYVIVGEINGWTDFGNGFPRSPRGASDAFVARYNAADELVFVNTFGGSEARGLDSAYGVVAADDGRIFVVGQFKGEMALRPDLVLSSATAARVEHGDGFILCLQADGEPCWAQRFGGPGADLGIDVAITAGGALAVAGVINEDAEFGDRVLAGFGGDDGFVARYNAASGELLSLLPIGGAGSDGLEDVTGDSRGDLLVSGYFADTVRFAGAEVTATERDLLVAKVIVAEPPAEDPFEGDDDPAGASRITSPWEHSHRCPAWLARRLRSADDTCEGIFANGFSTTEDGSRRAPPRGAEQVWSMRISGRTLTGSGDFYRVAVPDPGAAVWGGDNANIEPNSPPADPVPLPECGHVVREDLGPAGRDNNVNVNITGRFSVSILPAEDYTETGRGVRPDEPVMFYQDGSAAPELISRNRHETRVYCPRTLHELTEIVFSIGAGVPRSEFNMGEYDVQLEYVVEINRGIPDWASEPRFIDLGSLPDFSSHVPGNLVDIFRFHPSLENYLDCIADGPGCWELFTVAWPGGDQQFQIDVFNSPGMIFRLYDAEEKVLAETPLQQLETMPGRQHLEQQRLSIEKLPAGIYYLAIGGAPGNYSLQYTSVAAMPPETVKADNRLTSWLLPLLLVFALITIVAIVIVRKR